MITVKNGLLLINNNLEKRDLYLEDGKIKDICENLEVKGELIDAEGCFIMNGAIDAHVHLRQPGFEYKETIESGTMAAAKGGVTTCLAMPNLKPCPDSLENLAIEQEIIDREAKVNVLPYSALTVGQKSLELVDFESLKGKVVAFTDDGFGVNNIPLLRKAMEIAKKYDFVIASHAEDEVNSKLPEGEYVAVRREIEMAKEIGCKYHFCHMSTKESFDAIREARKQGYTNITCEVAPHHLILNEDMIVDGYWKMNPPLRSEENRLETIKALLDGTAQIIASDHAPHSDEEKNRGYEKSLNGIIGIETMIPIIVTNLIKKNLASYNDLNNWFNINVSQIFGLKPKKIGVGEQVDITLIDITNKRKYTKDEILSKSTNCPYIGMEFYGFPRCTILNEKIVWRCKHED